jgi:hypothetical protein
MSILLKRVRAGAAAAVGTCALLATAGCGAGGDAQAAATPTPTTPGRDLTSYDLFMTGSAQKESADAELYGIRFNPFRIDRLTTNKQIQAFGADGQHVVAATRVGDVDELSEVTGQGELAPIPGLGQVRGSAPSLRDGRLYYRNAQGDAATGQYGYFVWDFAHQTSAQLFNASMDERPVPAAGGRFVLTRDGAGGMKELVVRDGRGELSRFPLNVAVNADRVGRDYAALTTVSGVKALPNGLVLVNLVTGKIDRVPGVLVVGWSPDGTRLLGERRTPAGPTQLVLVDPAKPAATPTAIGTVPFPLFEGVWVRGEPAS